MSNISEIQEHIKSINDTMKITSAMHLIASSKIKKTKKMLDQTVPYFNALQKTLARIIEHTDDFDHVYFDDRPHIKHRKSGYLVIMGDKGLCGAYNHNVIDFVERHVGDEDATIFLVGLMGRKAFNKKNITVDAEFLYVGQKPTTKRAKHVAETLLDLFRRKFLDDIYVVYTDMVSPFKSEPRMVKLLPLEKHKISERADESKYQTHNTFFPSAKAVLDHIIPDYVRGIIYGCFVESLMSEQHARMTSMNTATDNAKELLAELSLERNRARQASITQQISEIVGGTMSLNEGEKL